MENVYSSDFVMGYWDFVNTLIGNHWEGAGWDEYKSDDIEYEWDKCETFYWLNVQLHIFTKRQKKDKHVFFKVIKEPLHMTPSNSGENVNFKMEVFDIKREEYVTVPKPTFEEALECLKSVPPFAEIWNKMEIR